MSKVAVFGSFPESLLNFRGPMLQAMVAAGHDVHAISPPAESETIATLAKMGISHHSVPLNRTGLNPLKDVASLIALVRLLRQMKPDCLLSYTIKPVAYGGLAATLTGVPFYAMITGLGYAFAGEGLKSRILGEIAGFLYKAGLYRARHVMFQNRDNLAFFKRKRFLRNSEQAVLINGSGIDLDHYDIASLPKQPVFLLIARLLRDKGVVEYVEAARMVKGRHPQAKFRLAGWIDDNPAAISRAELDGWIEEGAIEYLGQLQDVRPAVAKSAVYVLPSYHEGMPRTVLEAMSMGRPVITTDAPGCRDTVIDGDNGFLVPVKDATALAAAMDRFITEPELIPRMGKSSRHLAEQRYDVRKVNQVILETMGLQ